MTTPPPVSGSSHVVRFLSSLITNNYQKAALKLINFENYGFSTDMRLKICEIIIQNSQSTSTRSYSLKDRLQQLYNKDEPPATAQNLVFSNIKILSNILSFLLPTEMDGVLLTSPFFNITVPIACIEQLKTKRVLTYAEIRDYQNILHLDQDNYADIFNHCSCLTTLDLSMKDEELNDPESMHNIEDQEINQIIKNLSPALQHCFLLEEINVQNQPLTDQSITLFLKNKPFIRSLNLAGTGITNTAFSQLLPKAILLNRLIIAGTRISNDGFWSLAFSPLPAITYLDLSGCNVTDTYFIPFIKVHPLLKYLNLSWCDEISDVSLDALINSCPHLSELNLTGCDEITKEGLNRALISHIEIVYPPMHLLLDFPSDSESTG